MVGALSVVFTVCFRSAAAAQNYAIRLFHSSSSKWRLGWGFSPRAQAMTSAFTRQPTELPLSSANWACAVSNAISSVSAETSATNRASISHTIQYYYWRKRRRWKVEIKAAKLAVCAVRFTTRYIGNANHFNQHFKMDVCSVTVRIHIDFSFSLP